MSSPRRDASTLDVDDGAQSPGVEMQDRSTVAKLRRLASNPKYQKPPDPTQTDAENDPDVDAISVSAGDAASKLSSMLRRPSASHADIRRFIEKEYHKSSAAKELARHILLLIILIAGVTLHRSAYESFLMNQALTTTFVTENIDSEYESFSKDFKDIGQPDEFVGWFLSVLGGGLDQTTFYNDQNMTEDQQNYIMFSNRLIGGVRLRQLRVAPNRGCYKPNQLKKIANGTCYAYSYSASTRDTEPFGPPEDPTRYTYQTPEETGSVGVFGYVLDYLDGGGYVVDVNIEDKLNGTTYTEAFQQLLDDLWIDRQTRAVVISMSFLNMELDSRVAVMYLIIEIPGNGVFFPNYMIKTFRLNMYVSPLDYFRLFLEIVFVLLVLYSIYTESTEMVNNYRTGRVTGRGLKKYFYNGWNIIELIDIALYVTVIGLYVKYMASPERYNAQLDLNYYTSDMERLAALALGFYNVCAFNVIITTFRTFKYLKLNHRLYLLWKALRHAGLDLIGFLFIFLIFIFGFIFMGWLSFGADILGFSTFFRSFSTCWNFIIGNAPDYDEMFASNRILGPTFFVLFTIFIFFILANMFIAILSNSFDVVSESTNESQKKLKDVFEQKVLEVASALKKFYYVITKRDSKRRPITEILDNLANPDILDQPNITRDDVAHAIGPGATEMEIEDLHTWVKKLEARKQGRRSKAGDTVGRGSGAGLMADYEPEEEASTKSLMKSDAMAPPSPFLSPSDVSETKAALREMQAQMVELKQLIHRMSPQKGSNNNNDD